MSTCCCFFVCVFFFFFLQPAKQQRRPGVSHLSSLPQPRASPGWVCRRRSKSSTFPHSPLRRSRRYTNTISPSRMTSCQHSQHLFLLVWQLERKKKIRMLCLEDWPACVCLFQNFDHLFKVNDKAVGGSFYLQSKVSNQHLVDVRHFCLSLCQQQCVWRSHHDLTVCCKCTDSFALWCNSEAQQ